AQAYPAYVDIQSQASGFQPQVLPINRGITVKWFNYDQSTAHTATQDAPLSRWDSGPIPLNGYYAFPVSAAGTYAYHCTIHPSMTGKVKAKMFVYAGTGGDYTLDVATKDAAAAFVYDIQI